MFFECDRSLLSITATPSSSDHSVLKKEAAPRRKRFGFERSSRQRSINALHNVQERCHSQRRKHNKLVSPPEAKIRERKRMLKEWQNQAKDGNKASAENTLRREVCDCSQSPEQFSVVTSQCRRFDSPNQKFGTSV